MRILFPLAVVHGTRTTAGFSAMPRNWPRERLVYLAGLSIVTDSDDIGPTVGLMTNPQS
jgi:hypothetical protein